MGAVDIINPMIQASSLQNLQAIADTPPAKPSLKKIGGQQLILYIARVPGSRDVFLTTLKPREKTVTAYDVESSLYYCHRESELDDDLLHEDSDESEQDVPAAADAAADAEVNAEALASPPDDGFDSARPPPVPLHRVFLDQNDAVPALPPRPLDPPVDIKRKPVGSSRSPVRKPVPSLSDTPTLPPRPAGPRSMNGNGNENGHVQEEAYSLEQDLPPLKRDFEQAPALPRRPVSSNVGNGAPNLPARKFMRDTSRPRTSGSGMMRSTHSFDGAWSLGGAGAAGAAAGRPSMSPRSNSSTLTRTSSLNSTLMSSREPEQDKGGFNVTLIRRDPNSGVQTNVGKITVPPAVSRYGKPGKALLQLFNPGYERFREARGTSTADLVRCISEDDGCTYSCDLRLATRRRSMKNASAPYFGDVPVNQLIAVTPSQPYSFISPWNRVCEFSTGMSGRSLKCRHMLARGTLYDEDPNEMQVVSLSELRFNTPSSAAFAKISPKRPRHYHSSSAEASGGGGGGGGDNGLMVARKPLRKLSLNRLSHDSSTTGNRSTHYTHTHSHSNTHNHTHSSNAPFNPFDASSGIGSDDTRRPSESTAADDSEGDLDPYEHSPMDLALGQELAGGGLRGNKAKLGKLVIEPEGLEMLDLLVAANMGVWWSVR